MTGDDSRLLVIPGGVSSQFEDFSGQILEDGSKVHRCTSSDSLGVVTLAEKSVDTTDRELKTGFGRTRLACSEAIKSCTARGAEL